MMPQIESQILKDQPVEEGVTSSGRGNLRFPEWLELEVSADGTKGDCIVYPDNPYTRKVVVGSKNNYNARKRGAFAGRKFVHRYETRHGEPCIVIQRIA